jgi:hypothetical protein
MAGIGVQMNVRLVGKDDKRALVLLRLRDQLAQLLDKFRAPRSRGFAEQLVRLFVRQAERAHDAPHRLDADAESCDTGSQLAQRPQRPMHRRRTRRNRCVVLCV